MPELAAARLIVFIGIAILPTLIGLTAPSDAWYATLVKPTRHPPDWLFGPVWTILYAVIGYAGWLAWSSSVGLQRYRAFALYAAQLVLNTLWTPLLFGHHSPTLALFDIAALWAIITLNIVAFYHIKPAAGLLLLPYLLWISVALILTYSITF